MKNCRYGLSVGYGLMLFLLIGMFQSVDATAADVTLSSGQTVYVPVYSHIYTGDKEREIYLAVTLSIRNTDPDQAIIVECADYYDSHGILLKKYLKGPIHLKPFASVRYVVPESDKAGGSGANFVVRWKARNKVNSPRIEAIMISTRMHLGISFVASGQVIREGR